MKFSKLITGIAASLIAGVAALAQSADESIQVPVKFSVSGTEASVSGGRNGATTRAYTVTASLAGVVASGNDTVATTTWVWVPSGRSGGNYEATTTYYNSTYAGCSPSNQTAFLQVGKIYNFVVSSTANPVVSTTAIITPPTGYTLTVNGVAQNAISVGPGGSYTVRIIPSVDFLEQTAGTATSITSGQMKWSVALGSLKNGLSAGALSIVDAATSDWNALFTPAMLYYESISGEVFVYRVNGNIRQVSANEAFVDVVSLNATSYELRYYHAASVQGSAYPKTFIAVPFVTYRVQQGTSATQLTITKETRNPSSATDTAASIVRSETTTLTRTGTSPAFTWTLSDWALTGQTSPVQETRIWAANTSGGHDETITVADSSGVAAAQTFRSHTHFNWGDTPTVVTSGTTNPLSSNYAYNTDSTNQASYGFVSSQQSNSGNWEAFSYFPTTNTLQLGTISQTFQPFVNSPGTISTNTSAGLVTTYTYVADAFGMLTRPATIQTQINGTTTGNTTIAYATSTVNAQTLVTATRADKTSGSGSPLTSRTSYYEEDMADDFFRSQVHSIVSADGSQKSYVRQRGTLSGTTFTSGASGKDTLLGIIMGASSTSTGVTAFTTYNGYTVATIYLIPNKSTFDATYRDDFARIARTESYVWDGAAWQLIRWVNFSYNWSNQLISRVSSNGEDYEAGYVGDLKSWEQDGTGGTVYYDYDVAGRLLHATNIGRNGAPDLVTTYTYNAANQIISQSTQATGGSEQLTNMRTYDLAGRAISEISPGIGAITYAYDPVNRITTVTRPDGSTQIQTLYLDEQSASQTGTGVIPEYYTYSIQTSDGQKITQDNLASPSSARFVRTWTDWLGRTTRSERPGFFGTSQPVLFEQNTYNTTTGLLTRTDHNTGSAMIYQYDAVGNPVLSGLDVNNNGTLDLASADRITGQNKWFANENGAWWLATTSTTYASATSSTPTTVKSTRQRLTGFTGNLRSESRVTDAEGNITVQTVSVDQPSATVTKTTTLPGIANPQIDVIVNGLAMSSTSPDGLVSTTSYDGLQRPVTSVDSRTGTTTMAYLSGTMLPFTVTDPTGNVVTTYGYDNMGRKLWAEDAAGHFTRYGYDTLGHVVNQWGDRAYPCSYGYNPYGERITLKTYQSENGWDGATWPGGTPTSTTTWTYADPSGFLVSKQDASGQSVHYTYNSGGQVAQRFWARLNTSGQPVTATYSYDPNTNELLNTTYNDGTATVASTYNRLGQAATVSDSTGTRTFGWDTSSPWRLNNETLPSFYQGQVIGLLYENTTDPVAGTIKGRSCGLQLGTAAAPSAALQQTYGFSNIGRVTALTSAYGSGTVSQIFNYAYLANSRLVQSVAAQGTAFTQTRSYESQRNLLTSIIGQWSTTTYSSYGYTYNSLGQRQSSTQAGMAFADYGDVVTQNYTYNARGELSTAAASLGTSTGTQLPGRDFEYSYDAAGNRTSANHTGNPALAEHFSNNALNQVTSRENNSRAVSDTAPSDASVLVNSLAAARQGNYWNSELLLNNTGGTAVTPANVSIGASLGTGSLASSQTLYLLTGGASEPLTYDLDGNLTSDGIWTYSWDAENRLNSMTMNAWAVLPNGPPQQTIQFQYDYLGRRVKKQVFYMQAGSWVLQSEHRFIYDGWNLIAETQSDGLSLIRSYTWGLDLTGSFTAAGGVGALLQVTDHVTGTRYFPTYDGNGNVATLVNAITGSLAAIYEYNSFGELLRGRGSYASGNPIRFSSKYTDDETGLVYYGHRYYDAHNGRFINRDPIEESGGMNLYGFCGNDAVNQEDYLGNSWLSHFIKKARDSIIHFTRYIDPATSLSLRMEEGVGRYVNNHPQLLIVAAIIASIVTYGAASGWAAGLMLSEATANAGFGTIFAYTGLSGAATLTSLGSTVAGIVGGAAAGFAGGALGTALNGGSLNQSLTAGFLGAAGGAISGGIAGYYGNSWNLGRVGVTAVGGGVSSEITGGSFKQGFEMSGAIAFATDIAYNMRASMVANSKLDYKNSSGKSVGFFGDAFKLGGGRYNEAAGVFYVDDGDGINPKQELSFGAAQGGPGKIFGISYSPGSFTDKLVEAYAGPHDWLGSWWSYNNATGDNDYTKSVFGRLLGGGGLAKTMDSAMGAVDIPLATPIVAASVLGISPGSTAAFTSKHY